MATKKIKRFQEGGMSDKERGLEASKDDKVGFFERLRMGNIDDEGSEAYRRFGAGRGKSVQSPAPVEDRTPTPVIRESAKPVSEDMSSMLAAGAEAGKRQSSGDASVAEMYQGPRTKPVVAQQPRPGGKPSVSVAAPTKPAASKAPAMQEQSYRRTGGASAEDRASSPRVAPASNPNYSNEGRGKEMSKKQQLEREIDSIKPTEEQTQKGLENAMLPGAGLKTLSAAAKKLAAGKTSKLKTYDQPALPGPAQKALPSPTKRLAYDKAGAIAKRRADRASKRRDEMLDENAKNYGLDPKAPGYEAASGAVRKELGGKDFAFKKGGKVKSMKMSSGGSTSPASKRADGIATRGKTRCKIC
jgi:hypothetical protein